MIRLTQEDQKMAEDLLSRGYEKAAQSFAMMTKQQIKIKPTHIEVSADGSSVINNLKADKEIILITTTIIGEHGGKSYLLFNEAEANAVYDACMPPNADNYLRSIELEALLKELDNILSAAVITEFSNFLDSVIFGDVPIYTLTNQNQLKNKIKEDLVKLQQDTDYFIIANTQFIFQNNSKLCPQFIWKLTDEFMNSLKRKSDSNKNVA